MGPYRYLFGSMGWPFVVIGFLARLPVAMVVVGVLTMVTATRGSIAEAGIASAAVGLSSGVGGPLIGAAADRWGQRWVLTCAAVLNAAALTGLLIAVSSSASIFITAACAAISGFTLPQLTPLARARWVGMLTSRSDSRPGHINSAMAYESTADEITFIFGPVIVGLLASLISPFAPIVMAVVVTLIFVIAFAWHDSARHATSRADSAESPEPVRSLLRLPLMLPLLGMLVIGMTFGATLVSLTAFMSERGQETSTGLLYGAMSITSASFSLMAGMLPDRFGMRWRWVLSAGATLAAAATLPLVTSIPGAIGALLLMGIGIGPAMVTIFSLAADASPGGRLTTVMTLFGSSIIVGQSTATVAVSQMMATAGYEGGFFVVLALIGALFLFSLANAALDGMKAA